MNLAILRAVKACDGPTALARLVGVTPSTVSQWISGVRPVPIERCPLIEEAARGAVLCEELRPDVEWLRDKQRRITGYTVAIRASRKQRREAKAA